MGNLFYDEQPKLKLSDVRIGDYVQMRPEYGPVEDDEGDWDDNDLLSNWGCDSEELYGVDYDTPSVGVVIGKVSSDGIHIWFYHDGTTDEQDVPLEAVIKVQEPKKKIKNLLDQTL